MIRLYSGTPGSGKSLNATKLILDRLKLKTKFNNYVIANYNLSPKHHSEKFFYMDNSDITPEFLTDFAITFHKIGQENQSLLVIDEASIFFNCRDTASKKDRNNWVKFFQQHRKLGYTVILICQSDRMLDRQIRCFIEYDMCHRKLNNAGGFGFLLTILHIPTFMVFERWYGSKTFTNKSMFFLSKKVTKAYNSFDLFYDDRRQIEQPKTRPEELKAVQAVSNLAMKLIIERSTATLDGVSSGARGDPSKVV